MSDGTEGKTMILSTRATGRKRTRDDEQPSSPEAVGLLLRAMRFAAWKHRDQRRKGQRAEPYINHPLDLAHVLWFEGGVRDEATLVAALLHDPQVLILDEPLSGLDVNAARQFKELMTGLAAQGRTIFFCSHVLEVVERICHRVIVLHEGRIVANAPTAELLATARDRKLESLFRDLTNASEDDGVEELLSALGPSQAKALAKDKR